MGRPQRGTHRTHAHGLPPAARARDNLPDERVEAAVSQCLGIVETLGREVRLGAASAVLWEYDAAPVAIACRTDGSRRLVIGDRHVAPAQVRREARRQLIDQRPQSTERPQQEAPAGGLEVAHTQLDPAGPVVTATVELVHGSRRIVATSVGRNAEERRLFLMAEAAARAVTAFLPPEYGVVLQEIRPLPEELGAMLKAVVLFLTPTDEQPLEGVAPVHGNAAEAAARTVLSAVQERVTPLLERIG